MAIAPNNISSVRVIEAVAFEPVEIQEFKEYAKITFDDDDNSIDTILIAAREQLENATGQSFAKKTIEVEFSHNGYAKGIVLPRGPIAEIIDLQFTTCQCLSYGDDLLEADYSLKGDRFFGLDGYYKVQYKTGYIELPEQLRTAVKAQALYLYENRGDSSRSGLSGIALTLIQPFMKLC